MSRQQQVAAAIASVVALPAEISDLIVDGAVSMEARDISVAVTAHVNTQKRLSYLQTATFHFFREQIRVFQKMKKSESTYWRNVYHRFIRNPWLIKDYLISLAIDKRTIQEAVAEADIIYITAEYNYNDYLDDCM